MTSLHFTIKRVDGINLNLLWGFIYTIHKNQMEDTELEQPQQQIMQTLVYEMKDSSADGTWVLICHSDDDLQISQHNSRKSYIDAPRTSLNLHLEECFSNIVIGFILQTIIYKRRTNHKRPLLLAYPPSFRPRNTWSTPQTRQTLSRQIEKKENDDITSNHTIIFLSHQVPSQLYNICEYGSRTYR